MLTRARAAVLVLAGLTLAACGSIHPGDAAVVDGRSISMTTVNDTAAAFCDISLREAKDASASEPDNADLRRQTVTSLVALVVARKLADEQGVRPDSSAYEVTDSQKRSIATSFPSSDADQIAAAYEVDQELSALAIALGEKATGQARTPENEAQIAGAGQTEIVKAFKDNDVKFAPRFGIDGSLQEVASTLSVTPTDLGEDKPNQLPAAQRCT